MQRLIPRIALTVASVAGLGLFTAPGVMASRPRGVLIPTHPGLKLPLHGGTVDRSSRSSAEWILEAPTLDVAQTLLAPVGTVHFGPTSTYTASGKKHPIGHGNPTKIVLSPGGAVNEATPSKLASGGQAFNDCAYAQTCSAP